MKNAAPAGPNPPDPELLLLQAAALETSATSILIADRKGKIVWVNSAFTDLTGYLPAEAIGNNPRLLQSGHHDSRFYQQLWSTILRGETWRGEFTNRRKDGTLYVDRHTITPVRSKAGEITHFVAIMQDVSEQKRAEAEVQRLNRELEQRVRDRTEQLEAANKELEAFSYSVSHDLRAPLRAINGFARMVSEEYSNRLDSEGQRLLGTICLEAQRMGQLIDDLLAFSKLGRQKLEAVPIDMQALAQAAFSDLTRQSAARPRLELRELPVGCGDRAMLRQVFLNLLSNAIKFSAGQEAPVIEIGGCQADDHNLYYVKDNGVGFDEKFSHRLFGVFQRLHREEEFEGTGVGLALVDRIIRRHGGKIWAQAKLNQGATFSFTLPIPGAKSE